MKKKVVESVTTKSQIPPIQQTSTIDDIPSTSSTKPIEEKFVPLPENEIHFKDNKLLTNLSQMDLTKRPVEDFHNEMVHFYFTFLFLFLFSFFIKRIPKSIYNLNELACTS